MQNAFSLDLYNAFNQSIRLKYRTSLSTVLYFLFTNIHNLTELDLLSERSYLIIK